MQQDIRADFHSAEGTQGGDVFWIIEATVFVQDDRAIKRYVVADVKLWGEVGYVRTKALHGRSQGNSKTTSFFGADPVNSSSFSGNGKTIGVNHVVSDRHLVGIMVVQRPADGDDSILWCHARGFRVEDEEHVKSSWFWWGGAGTRPGWFKVSFDFRQSQILTNRLEFSKGHTGKNPEHCHFELQTDRCGVRRLPSLDRQVMGFCFHRREIITGTVTTTVTARKILQGISPTATAELD